MKYLNYAALSPTRLEAQQEVEATLAEFRALLYSPTGLDWYGEKIWDFRRTVADLLDVSQPASIAFVPNASMASHLALSFVPWQPGDVILTSTHENPSVLREIQWLAHRQVELLTVKPTSTRTLLTTIREQLPKHQIKAMVLSHVSHVDGRIFPIAEIGKMAKDRGILFLVDGAQAVGHIPVNLDQLDVDIYFFPGHKWCQGPLGTGILILRESFLSKNPVFVQAGLGWNQTQAGRFEIGTHNIGLIAGLAKSCQLLQEEGMRNKDKEKIRESAKKSLNSIKKLRIQEWAGPHAPGILTFRCEDLKIHESVMGLFQTEMNIVVKQFRNYPEAEFPSIRLSWTGSEDTANALLAVRTIEKKLGIR